MTRIDVAGRDVTQYLQVLLRKSGHNFHTTAEMEIVKNIKETKCWIAYNYDKSDKAADEEEPTVWYKLPDGQQIELGAEKYQAPELLFNPSLMGFEYVGIHEVTTFAKPAGPC